MSNEDQKPDKAISSINGERNMPNVSSAKRSKNNTLAILFGVVSVLLTGVYGYISFFTKDEEPEIEKPSKQINIVSTTFPTLPPSNVPDEKAEEKKKADEDREEDRRIALETEKMEAEKAPPPRPFIDHTSGAVMISTKGKPKKSSDSEQTREDKLNGDSSEQNSLGEKLVATSTNKAGAGYIKKRHFVLAKGAVINCSLQTQIDSSIPGFVSCVTTRNVYSDTGTVLLLERGSQIVGEYQGNIEQGIERLFILWTRVKTPNGIIIDLNSPATDVLGGAGADGYVDTKFWRRFGTAMLLSVFDQAYVAATDIARINIANKEQRRSNRAKIEAAAAGVALGGGGSIGYNSDEGARINFDFNSTLSPVRDIINDILQRQANIPMSMTKNHGDKISIFVARDLDFSEVYDVRVQ